MTTHTVKIKALEATETTVTVPTMLGTAEMEFEPALRAIIDVDDKVTDHWHYFKPEALVNRMDLYGLDNEIEAVEALERELVRSWAPVQVAAGAHMRERLGGIDKQVEVVWEVPTGKAQSAIDTFRDRIDAFRKMQEPMSNGQAEHD